MRLIDADALKELFSETIGGIAKEPEMTGNLEHMVRASAMVIQMIDDQPTIGQPRVLTLLEVIDHYSVPHDVENDIDKKVDYLNDIKPLYFDFPLEEPFNLHWRGYDTVIRYLDEWKLRYGKTWRVWTDKPTEEQRKAVPWEDGEQE